MKNLRTFIAGAVAMAAMAVAFPACSDDDDNRDISAVPPAFVQALDKVVPDAKNVKWEREGEYRVAEFYKNGVDYDVWFDASAAWAMTEMDYGRDFMLVPHNAVNEAFSKGDYAYWKVDDISYYEQTSDAFYVIEVEKAGQPDTDLYYALDGTMRQAIPSASSPDIFPVTVVP